MITWKQIAESLTGDGHINWRDMLDERQQKEVEFSEIYARDYHHGTDGHNSKLIITKMAEILDGLQGHITLHDMEAGNDE